MDKFTANIIYIGTPQLSADTFESLIKAGVHFVALITQEDKEVGRHHQKQKTPTKLIAEKYHIPVYQPHKIREDYAFVNNLHPDLILTFAYGQIIPKGLLDIPKYGCVNLHASLLPKYRGAAPIQRAIIDGETLTGVTLMQMVEKMDAGVMYAKENVEILPSDNYSSLSNKVSLAATKLALNNLDLLLNNKIKGEVQDEQLVTFANKINQDEEHIDLILNAINQVNLIRGLSFIPGAYLLLNNEKIKILEAKVYSNEVNYQIGEIALINKHFVYQAKDALIEIIKILPQGKKMMNAIDFINGHKDIVGKIFK